MLITIFYVPNFQNAYTLIKLKSKILNLALYTVKFCFVYLQKSTFKFQFSTLYRNTYLWYLRQNTVIILLSYFFMLILPEVFRVVNFDSLLTLYVLDLNKEFYLFTNLRHKTLFWHIATFLILLLFFPLIFQLFGGETGAPYE